MTGKRKLFISTEYQSHFDKMAQWLALETAAEVQRMAERRKTQNAANAEKSGESILDLVIDDSVVGLGGMQLVTFKRRNRNLAMPWHRLRVGSPVVVTPQLDADARHSETGVVSGRHAEWIQVALSRVPGAGSFRIDLTADEITRQRQLAAIMTVKEAGGRLGHLRSVMMGARLPQFREAPQDLRFRAALNASQQAAVRFALSADDLAIIHGPPGTGKTTTVVELIVHAIERGEKVLAAAPSNTAVDNLLERLIAMGQRVLRIGHPARVTEDLRDFTLDGLVDQHEHQKVIKELRREAKQLLDDADRWTRAKRSSGDRYELRKEARLLQNHAKMLERQAVASVLDRADVVCATTTFNEETLGDRWFDLAVIDEACQSTEPGTWAPLLRVQKVVLAGDHQQLPPTVLSHEAATQGFAKSLMERQIEQYGERVTCMLTLQYRMHEKIMNFSAAQFYDESLVADHSVASHALADLPHVSSNHFTQSPVAFIDTAGANWDEELEPEGLSKRNPREADLILRKVAQLIQNGLPPSEIAVIAPYAAQVRLLRERFDGKGLEIDTVDGFQGREKEAVLITLVRSNDRQELGFLADRRRMNVALTRARRKLIVIGDSATFGGNEFYQSFFKYIDSIGAYHTVWEEELDDA